MDINRIYSSTALRRGFRILQESARAGVQVLLRFKDDPSRSRE